MKPSVLFVAAEAVPLAKTGGLGDAVSGLANALQQRGVDVTVLIPAYPGAIAAAASLRKLGKIRALAGDDCPARLLLGRIPGSEVKLALLDSEVLYKRPGNLYSDDTGRNFDDNGKRFAALCGAAAQIAAGNTPLDTPHVVHAHDWHAGLTPMLMRELGVKTPSIQTIHNLAFQGVFPMDQADSLGIPVSARHAEGVEFWGKISYLKAGINYADRITTVSRSYAREVLTPRFGHGLDGVLRMHSEKFRAIPNGIDAQIWNPAGDSYLPQRYSASERHGKSICKQALQRTFGLALDPDAALITHGSRLTGQKMADIAVGALRLILEENPRVQVAVLGCGELQIENDFNALARQYPGRVGVHIGYDEELAHLLHGGADMLLHGSRFEPFGLTPLYAMHYGTVPIVSRVGGMMDTVRDLGTAGATGFLFDGEHIIDMARAIRRALQVFSQPALWQTLQNNGMRTEFSWVSPAKEYLSLYGRLTKGVIQQAFLNSALEQDAEIPTEVPQNTAAPARKPTKVPRVPVVRLPAAGQPIFAEMKPA